MKRYVMDSYALFVYLEKEKNWETVSDIFKKALDGECEILLSVVNWGEVYYVALREGGSEKAELYRKLIDEYPVNIVDADKQITLSAARFKAFNKISYADAFAAALADIKKGVLITGDKEFGQIGKYIKIQWI